MKRRRKQCVPLSDVDRIHLIPDKVLLEELARRFSGEGRTITAFARVASGSVCDTYFLEGDDNTELSKMVRLWWQLYDGHVPKDGDSMHIYESGEWIDYTAGEDLDKESPNDKQE